LCLALIGRKLPRHILPAILGLLLVTSYFCLVAASSAAETVKVKVKDNLSLCFY
jgi:hypothetical protein